MRFAGLIAGAVFMVPSVGSGGELSPWSDAHGGLSMRVALPEWQIPMGSKFDLVLHFRYDAVEPGGVRFMTCSRDAWSATVRFESRTTPAAFERGEHPFPGGPPFRSERPEDHVVLAELGARELRVTRYLLSDEGEQIPPGEYDVFVTFSNDGGDGLRTIQVGEGDGGKFDTIPYPDGTLWTGAIESGPVRLTVLPADPDTVSFEMPTRISITNYGGQLSWEFDRDRLAQVTVTVAPGFHATPWMRVNYTLAGEPWPPSPTDPADEDVYGINIVGTPDWSSRPWYALGGPRLTDFLGPDRRIRVEVILSIYEVLPGRGGWELETNPTLWQDTLAAVWPPE